MPSPKCICSASSDGIVCFIYQCYHTMSTIIHCSMVSVVSVYIQIMKIMYAFVSCVLYHHVVKVILYDGCLDCRGLYNSSLYVPIYQLDAGSCSVCSVCCCGSSSSRRCVALIRIVIENKSITFTHIRKRIWVALRKAGFRNNFPPLPEECGCP